MRPYIVHWLDGFLPGGIAAALAPTWFTCVGLAGAVTLFVMLAIARRRRIDSSSVASIVLWCYVAAVAAGIVIPSAIDAAQQWLATGRAHIRWAGMTSFWGYLAGSCAIAVVCRAHDIPLRRFADLTAAPLGIALMLARLGCFVAGCDYGKVTSLPWAVRFPAHSPAWQDHVHAGLLPAGRSASLPVHPTQLYEAALGLAIAVLALAIARSRWARSGDGRVFLVAAILYAVGRITVENLRGDAGRGIYLGLSSGQIFSWLVLAVIAAGCCLRRFRPAAATTATTALVAVTLVVPEPVHAQPAASPRAAPSPRQPASPRAAPSPRQPAPPRVPSPTQPAPQPQPTPAPQRQPEQPFGPALPPSDPPQPPPPVAPPPPPPPPVYPYVPPGPGPVTISVGAATAETAEPVARSTIQIGALVGYAAPFNRRADQVAPLGGASLSIGIGFHKLGVWLDLESFGNRDASHGTVLLSGGMLAPISPSLWIGGRAGFGATLVNFDEAAFRDVAGITGRFDLLLDVRLGDSWALCLRPLSLDVVSAADLGGPIATWQARIGLAYHFDIGRRAALRSAPAPDPSPYPSQPGSASAPYPAAQLPSPTPRSR